MLYYIYFKIINLFSNLEYILLFGYFITILLKVGNHKRGLNLSSYLNNFYRLITMQKKYCQIMLNDYTKKKINIMFTRNMFAN